MQIDIETEDYYAILRVPPEATRSEISTAYHEQAKRYDPDRNPGFQKLATERLKAVNEAYEVLNDPARRAAYDHSLNDRARRAAYDQTLNHPVHRAPHDQRRKPTSTGDPDFIPKPDAKPRYPLTRRRLWLIVRNSAIVTVIPLGVLVATGVITVASGAEALGIAFVVMVAGIIELAIKQTEVFHR
jgi:hypothetical protein